MTSALPGSAGTTPSLMCAASPCAPASCPSTAAIPPKSSSPPATTGLTRQLGSGTLDTGLHLTPEAVRRLACDAAHPSRRPQRSRPATRHRPATSSHHRPSPPSPGPAGTVAAPSRAAIDHRAGATPTTSSTGPTAARPASPTPSCSAATITGTCTTATGPCAWQATATPNSSHRPGSTPNNYPAETTTTDEREHHEHATTTPVSRPIEWPAQHVLTATRRPRRRRGAGPGSARWLAADPARARCCGGGPGLPLDAAAVPRVPPVPPCRRAAVPGPRAPRRHVPLRAAPRGGACLRAGTCHPPRLRRVGCVPPMAAVPPALLA